MFFVLSKLVWALVRPGNLLVLLLAAGQGLRLSRTPWVRRLAGRITTTVIWLMVAITVLPVGDWSLRPLEDRFPQPELPAHVDGIILLGGSVHTEMTDDRGQPVINNAGERITEFVALARRYPDARLLFTGGSGFVFKGDLREADVVAEILGGVGFDLSRLTFERESRNTYENAVNSRALVAPRRGETWVLVTSAAHMPRSVGIFRHVGWPVLAFPVDYRTRRSTNWWPDFLGGLDALNESAREWIGLLAYWLHRRTDALFPGPIE
jgi:uncharacterized SAM-binding protein YcdF (DUF218 family)